MHAQRGRASISRPSCHAHVLHLSLSREYACACTRTRIYSYVRHVRRGIIARKSDWQRRGEGKKRGNARRGSQRNGFRIALSLPARALRIYIYYVLLLL